MTVTESGMSKVKDQLIDDTFDQTVGVRRKTVETAVPLTAMILRFAPVVRGRAEPHSSSSRNRSQTLIAATASPMIIRTTYT
jgi:hypothetical protein